MSTIGLDNPDKKGGIIQQGWTVNTASPIV